MNPVPGGTQSFASAAENRQVPTHFPGTSIARNPALEAKFQISAAPGCALVSSAAARRRFPQARPGSPANRLRHSTSAGSGYTQLPIIRKGNVRKLAGASDPAGVEPPAAQSGARSPHSKVAPSMRRRCETQLANRDSEFPTHSLRRRSLRQGLPRSLRRGLSRKQLFASLFRELRRELCRINTSRKVCPTFQQNSLATDSIARQPAPEAKFQIRSLPLRRVSTRLIRRWL